MSEEVLVGAVGDEGEWTLQRTRCGRVQKVLKIGPLLVTGLTGAGLCRSSLVVGVVVLSR